jgi:ArsR family transcriptional regulator
MENALMIDKRTQSLVENCMLSEEILSDLTCFFTIFSDKTRLKMLSVLAISRMCVSDLAGILNLNQTTVSHQLRLLKNLGAVDFEREGKIITYFLKDELISDMLLKGMEFLGNV